MKKRISGWLRLWIVVSAFWAAGMCAYALNQYWLATTPKTALVGYDTQGKKKIRVLVSSDVTEEEAKALIDTKIIPDLNGMKAESWPSEINWPFEKRKAKRTEELLSLFLLFGILPPVVLIMLGKSFVWVRGGFRKKSET